MNSIELEWMLTVCAANGLFGTVIKYRKCYIRFVDFRFRYFDVLTRPQDPQQLFNG